jgi:hypothetical protein
MQIEVGKNYVDGYGNVIYIGGDRPIAPFYRYKGFQKSNPAICTMYSLQGRSSIRAGKGDLVMEYAEETKMWGHLSDIEKGAILLANVRGFTIEFRYSGKDWVDLNTSATAFIGKAWMWRGDWYYRVKAILTEEVEKPTLDGKTATIDGVDYILKLKSS